MKVTNTVNSFILAVILLLSANFNAYGYDFFGSDIASVLVTTPDQCAAACNGNANCQAWTFVRPPLKHPTSAVCFLKNTVPAPSLNSVCTSNSVCLSGITRSDGWCGETPLRNVGGSGVQGQDQVLSCPSGQSCRPRITQTYETCWFFFKCRGPKIQTTDFFCQSP
ncbi:MAG: PAN domain-containing protein [Nitrospirae bacterium]|nr:PAN domain-containing protein [Nitrospirota bacterium]